MAPCREVPNRRNQAAMGPPRPSRPSRNRDRRPRTQTPANQAPAPRTSGYIGHPRQRDCRHHAHDGRAGHRPDRGGGDPRESRGSARSAAGARATMRAARRLPAATRRCAGQNPHPEDDGRCLSLQGPSPPGPSPLAPLAKSGSTSVQTGNDPSGEPSSRPSHVMACSKAAVDRSTRLRVLCRGRPQRGGAPSRRRPFRAPRPRRCVRHH